MRHLLAALPEYGEPLENARREADRIDEEDPWDPRYGPEEPNLWFEFIGDSLARHAGDLPAEATAAVALIVSKIGHFADVDRPLCLRRFEALPAALSQIANTYLAALERFEATYLDGDCKSAGEPEHPMSCGWAEPGAAFGLRMDLVRMHTSSSGGVVDSWRICGRDDAIAECMVLAQRILVVVTACGDANHRQSAGQTSIQVAPHARMNEARAAHTATALADGRVLVAGGCTRAGCDGITSSAELYDPAAASFVNTASMSIGRVSHTATLLADGSVLVTGGWTAEGTTTSSELYEPVQGRFAVRARMLRARAAHRAIALGDGRVLVIGGDAATGSALASAELYDPSTDRFDAGGDMLHARTNHSATRLRDGRILVIGGRQSRTSVPATAEIFDPTTGESRATGSMALPREKHEAVLLRDGRVLVVGGSDAQEARHATTEIYDPEQGLFTAGPSMRSPRYKLAGSIVVTDAGHVVVTGGAAEVESLTAEHGNGFKVVGRMDGPREFTSATTLPDGTILVAGGYDGRIDLRRARGL